MADDHDLNSFNLWDLEVTSIRFFQPTDIGRPTYDLIVEVGIRSGTLGPDSPKQSAQFWFCDCQEFGVAIDVRMWSMVGPELAEGRAVVFDGYSSFTRYTLEMRPPGGSLEVLARSFRYEGPNIRKIVSDP
jgi:hypothetical protein